MTGKASQKEEIEALKSSLAQASKKVESWSAAKHESAEATVGSMRLASYYEPIPKAKKI